VRRERGAGHRIVDARPFVDALVERTDALKRIAGDRPFALALNDLD